MAAKNRMERLQNGIAEAIQRLEFQPKRPDDHSPSPQPGDLYVFDTGVEGTVEWMVVRPHPDDAGIVLLAPADDFPLAGRPDVSLKPEFINRPLTVRCGETVWIAVTACPEHLHVGFVPDEAVTLVRQKLAALARGSLMDDRGAARVEADPEYRAWLSQIAIAREAVERRNNALTSVARGTVLRFEQFVTQPPSWLTEEAPVALAANSGGALLAALAESLATVVPRYSEISVRSGGTLLLTAVASGVRVSWRGTKDSAPPSLTGSGMAGPAQWRPGIQGGTHHAEPTFQWVNGEIGFVIGTENPQTITVQL